MTCLNSQTPVRRALIRMVPGRKPKGWHAAIMLRAAYRLAGFTDWLGVRLETLICELERQ